MDVAEEDTVTHIKINSTPDHNPFHPLPYDYDTLTEVGKKKARLHVLHKQDTPADLVNAWYLFRSLYLAKTQEAILYDGLVESPEFHYELIRDVATYGRNAWAAPRGSAKSTVIGLELPLLLVFTKPGFSITLGMATDTLVEERFDLFIKQFQSNELLLADFGSMVPKRGSGIFNHHQLSLTNGSILRGLSVMGKKRGGRPNMFILDDVEFDPDSEGENARLIIFEKFEMILFKQIIPMLKKGALLQWVGTLIDRKSFLYRLLTGDDTRYGFWNRTIYKACCVDENEELCGPVLWPALWDIDVLQARKGEIGASQFASEYLNQPVSAQDRYFKMDPYRIYYEVDGDVDPTYPLASTAELKWHERFVGEDVRKVTWKEKTVDFGESVGRMFRVLMFDYAQGLRARHDYSCIAICGFDTKMTMWVLDLWMGRAKEAELHRLIYNYGYKWRCRALGIESAGMQRAFVESSQEFVEAQSAETGHQWRPRVIPVKYPGKESKWQRIASSLGWRFDTGRIKFPRHLEGVWPWDQLFRQVKDFTLDGALLTHDDAIDTIAQSKYIVKGRGQRRDKETGEPSLLERIKKETAVVDGLPVLSGVSTSEVTHEMMGVLEKKYRTRIGGQRIRRRRRKTRIIR